jgi:hypothetical protein
VLMPLGQESEQSVLQKLRDCEFEWMSPSQDFIQTLFFSFLLCRGSMGSTLGLSLTLKYSQCHCTWWFRLACLCCCLCNCLVWSCSSNLECPIIRWYDFILSERLYLRILYLSFDSLCHGLFGDVYDIQTCKSPTPICSSFLSVWRFIFLFL